MKKRIAIPIEEIRVGDIDPKTGKKVVGVLNRLHASFIRAILEGGWPLIEGYYGKMIEVIRR